MIGIIGALIDVNPQKEIKYPAFKQLEYEKREQKLNLLEKF